METNLVTRSFNEEHQDAIKEGYRYVCKNICRKGSFKYAFEYRNNQGKDDNDCFCTSEAPVNRDNDCSKADSQKLISAGLGHSVLSLPGNLNDALDQEDGWRQIIDSQMIEVLFFNALFFPLELISINFSWMMKSTLWCCTKGRSYFTKLPRIQTSILHGKTEMKILKWKLLILRLRWNRICFPFLGVRHLNLNIILPLFS